MLRRVGTSACRRYVIAPDTRRPDPPDRYRQAAIAAIVGRSGRRHPAPPMPPKATSALERDFDFPVRPRCRQEAMAAGVTPGA